jgi:hypothetical protein
MKLDAQQLISGLLFGLGGGIGYAIFELIATKF